MNKMVYTTQVGQICDITEMSDPVFAMKVLGDGIVVIPDDELVYAPIGGVLKVVSETKHAYGIETEDGCEILIHVGIDSVELNGEGFTTYVTVGSPIKAGEKLCKIDKKVFDKHNISTETAIIITNKDAFKITEKYLGRVNTLDGVFAYTHI